LVVLGFGAVVATLFGGLVVVILAASAAVTFASALKRGEYSKTPLAQDTSKIKNLLYLFSFLCVVEYPKYNARQTQLISSIMDDNVDQPASCRTKKPSELFVDGRQTSGRDQTAKAKAAGMLKLATTGRVSL
jgi:hypothetical protein